MSLTEEFQIKHGCVMKRAYVFNTGCIRRALDITKIHAYLLENGWSFTNSIARANLVVVSTCGAVKKTEDLSVIALKHIAKKMSKNATMIVTGCLPSINPEAMQSIPDIDRSFFVPARELDRIDEVLESEVRFHDISEANLVTNEMGLFDYVLAYRLFRHSFFLKLYKKMSTSRAFLRLIIVMSQLAQLPKRLMSRSAIEKVVPYYNLRIAEGCVFKCSFCAIRFATKRVRSKPIKEIISELGKGVAAGHKIFQLVCEDVGCYGLDIGSSFPELLKHLFEVEGDHKLVMLDFGGYWLVKYYDEMLPLLKSNPHRLKEFYVSIQSGSDRILKAMKRPEKNEEVVSALQGLKGNFPHLKLRTTVIVGFPGESEEDFDKTVHALQQVDFAAVEINKYEDRPGTAASRMKDKIPAETIERRVQDLADRVSAARGSRRA